MDKGAAKLDFTPPALPSFEDILPPSLTGNKAGLGTRDLNVNHRHDINLNLSGLNLTDAQKRELVRDVSVTVARESRTNSITAPDSLARTL